VDCIRWGIVGCGDVTEVKSGPGMCEADRSSVVAVMRRTGHLAEDYARRHKVPRWYDDADKLINDSEVDAVYVATPPGSHLEYGLRACRAGKPAYVEKPMARNHQECREMVDAFRAADVDLFVAYYRRALPRFLKAKELINSGELGVITAVRYRFDEPIPRELDPKNLPWRLSAAESGGGLFFDLGSHALDIIDFLLGPLVDIGGIAANRAHGYDVEDSVAMHFGTACGAVGVASWNFASPVSRDRIQILGTKGRVTLSVFGNEPVSWEQNENRQLFDLSNPKHIQQPMIQTVVDSLLGRGRCDSTGESAARTARVMDAVVENYYGSRGNGFWDDPRSWPGRKGWSLAP